MKIASGKYPMIVENRAAGNLMNPLYNALSGIQCIRNSHSWPDKKDKAIASKVMTVLDDPLIISGAGSRHFDEKVLVAEKRAVIEDGILHNYYIDTYYGRKLKMDPTSGVHFECGV